MIIGGLQNTTFWMVHNSQGHTFLFSKNIIPMKTFFSIVLVFVTLCIVAYSFKNDNVSEYNNCNRLKNNSMDNSCNATKQQEFSCLLEPIGKYGWYNNVTYCDNKLVAYLMQHDSTDSLGLPLGPKSIEIINSKELIPEDIFKKITIFPVVNKWSEYIYQNEEFYPTKEEKIEMIIKDSNFFFIGVLYLSKSFHSFLVMQKAKCIDNDSNPPIDRNLYLINIKNDTLTCVAELSSLFDWEGEALLSYTTTNGEGAYFHNNTFSIKEHNESINKDEFFFDNNGRIVVNL